MSNKIGLAAKLRLECDYQGKSGTVPEESQILWSETGLLLDLGHIKHLSKRFNLRPSFPVLLYPCEHLPLSPLWKVALTIKQADDDPVFRAKREDGLHYALLSVGLGRADVEKRIVDDGRFRYNK